MEYPTGDPEKKSCLACSGHSKRTFRVSSFWVISRRIENLLDFKPGNLARLYTF
jgi:hypothetical protein